MARPSITTRRVRWRSQSVGDCSSCVRASQIRGKHGAIQTILECRTNSNFPPRQTGDFHRKSLYQQSAHPDRWIKKFNAKFIRDKSGLRLAGVPQFILKMVKYAPLEGRGCQPLPEFLLKKEAIINIQNNKGRCFGYALLYFLERANLPEKNCRRANLFTNEMFQPHDLDTLIYLIAPNDVHLYED